MTRVAMPSRDSPGSVDPDDVEVAEVDTLFIQQGRAGAALGAAGCTGRGLLSSAVRPRAELSAQDCWGEKEQVSGGVPSEASGALHHRWMPGRAEQSRTDEAYSLPSAGNTEGKGSSFIPSLPRLHLYPTALSTFGEIAQAQKKQPPGKGVTSPFEATFKEMRANAAC